MTTKRNDGARYITDLYARGVRNFVLSEESFRLMDNGQLTIDNAMQRDDAQSIVNYLIVPNPLKALQNWRNSIGTSSRYRSSVLREATARPL